MTKKHFKTLHRAARLGDLGNLACTVPGDLYRWLLSEVYDLRFPHVGEDRRHMDDMIRLGAFNDLHFGGRTQRDLSAWHYARGWVNCRHKSLLRLWVEFKAISSGKRFTDSKGKSWDKCPEIGTWTATPLKEAA